MLKKTLVHLFICLFATAAFAKGPYGATPFDGNGIFEMLGMSTSDPRMQQLRTYLQEDPNTEFSESLWFSRKKGLEIGMESGRVARVFVHGRSPYNYGTQPFPGTYVLGISHTESQAAIVGKLGKPAEEKSWGGLIYYVEHQGKIYYVSVEMNSERRDVKHTYIKLDDSGASATISTKDHGGAGGSSYAGNSGGGGLPAVASKPTVASGAAGCIQGDCYNGMGTYVWESGSKYIGEYKDGVRQGFGSYYFSNGDTYVGEWKDNNRNGTGVYEYGAGVGRYKKYIGEWKDGKRTGVGLMYYQDGSKQLAEWKDDSFVKETKTMGHACIQGDCTNGQATHVWDDDGSYYIGTYKNGQKEGKGTYYYAKGGKYVGYFKNGVRHGQGVYYYPNGSRYDGDWQEDSRNGYGVLYRKGGEVLKTTWQDGTPAKR